jgi:hypothetical protein
LAEDLASSVADVRVCSRVTCELNVRAAGRLSP